jgi:hypothetical protein
VRKANCHVRKVLASRLLLFGHDLVRKPLHTFRDIGERSDAVLRTAMP